MQNGGHRRNGTELALIILACALALLIVLGLLRLAGLLGKKQEEHAAPASTAAPTGQALSVPEDWLPQNMYTGRKPPEAVFRDAEGSEIPLISLLRAEDSGLWLVFWASWCPDCDRQFQIISQMEALAEDRGVRLVLVDRLNPERESVTAAQAKLASVGASAETVYDPGEKVYRAWGMREIPSAVILDAEGTVRAYSSGSMTAGECRGLLNRALDGPDAAGLALIRTWLSVGDGGIATSTVSGGHPGGEDVLSESQGLMLWYALRQDNQPLFEKTWSFVRTRMLTDGLTAWYVSGESPASVNATLDDLRLWYALYEAERKWPGQYAACAKELASGILRRCVNSNGGLVDWAELNGSAQADTISLSYLDLGWLRLLAESDPGFGPVADNAEAILRGGRISDSFPLYYSSYSYAEETYSQADLNMAEALMTLWNLSRAGELPSDAWGWLRERIMAGSLAARCHTDGSPVSGYDYHATAVWGLAALIAREEDDAEAFERALRRMNRLFVLDTEDTLYGAYAQRGAAVQAFDQLIPLLVNSEGE